MKRQLVQHVLSRIANPATQNVTVLLNNGEQFDGVAHLAAAPNDMVVLDLAPVAPAHLTKKHLTVFIDTESVAAITGLAIAAPLLESTSEIPPVEETTVGETTTEELPGPTIAKEADA